MSAPSVQDQADAGSGAAQAVVDELERAADYVASVAQRMRDAVLHGVPDDSSETGMRNLADDQAGALIGVLRTLQTLLANTDVAVAKIVGEPPLAKLDHADWPVHL